MTRSKKIFAGFALAFVVLLVLVTYDFGRRTSFPGSRSQKNEQEKEQPHDQKPPADTIPKDSTR